MDRKEFLQQMIAEYQKKIERYQENISEWKAELGASACPPGVVKTDRSESESAESAESSE